MAIFALLISLLIGSPTWAQMWDHTAIPSDRSKDPQIITLDSNVFEEFERGFKHLETAQARMAQAEREISGLIREFQSSITDHNQVIDWLAAQSGENIQKEKQSFQKIAIALSNAAKELIHADGGMAQAFAPLGPEGTRPFRYWDQPIGQWGQPYRYWNKPYFRSNYYSNILAWLEKTWVGRGLGSHLTGIDLLRIGERTDLTREEYSLLEQGRRRVEYQRLVLTPMPREEWEAIHHWPSVEQYRRSLEQDASPLGQDQKTAVLLYWHSGHYMLIYPYSSVGPSKSSDRFKENGHQVYRFLSFEPFDYRMLSEVILSGWEREPRSFSHFIQSVRTGCQKDFTE